MKKYSRFLPLLLCILLVLPLATAVYGADMDPGEKGPYVLHYDVDGDGYDGQTSSISVLTVFRL